MDRQYIDDNHVVARYLADQLADAEREAFEAYSLAHPEILSELEAAARFKVGLGQLDASGRLAYLEKPAPAPSLGRWLRLAALFAAVALGLAFLVHQYAAPPILALNGSVSPQDTYDIVRTRGGGYDAEIAVTADTEWVRVRLLPEAVAEPPRYRLVLYPADAGERRPVAEVRAAAPDADGFVPADLRVKSLAPGGYELVIGADAGTSSDAASSFRVLLQKPTP